MNKKQLDTLSESLSKAISPTARKIEATARILEKVEPLPVVTSSPGVLNQRQELETETTDKTRDTASIVPPEDTSPPSKNVDEPVENTLAKMTTVVTQEPSGWPMSTMAKMTTVGKLTEVKGELRIPNTIVDSLLPTLEPAAALVYLRLYRLSYGYKKDTCTVGFQKLAVATKTSQKTAQRAVEYLERHQLIQRIGTQFGGKTKGNQFKVLLPTLANVTMVKTTTPVKMATLANLTTVAKMTSNKNDDDLLNSNHHQKAENGTFPHLAQTVSTYTQLTSNPWLDSDTSAYQENQINHVPIERVKTVIHTLVERSGRRINSFNYFVKEILAENQPNTLSRHRKALVEIVRRVGDLHVGSVNYSLADLTYDVKAACAREGIVFDNDQFNEILRRGVPL